LVEKARAEIKGLPAFPIQTLSCWTHLLGREDVRGGGEVSRKRSIRVGKGEHQERFLFTRI